MGLDWHLRTRQIDNGSISRHSEAKRHVQSGFQPLAAVAQRLRWPTKAKKKKKKKKRRRNQCSCGDLGHFLKILIEFHIRVRFIIFVRLLRGVGVSKWSRAFSVSPACLTLRGCAALHCRRSVRVCAASTKIRLHDGWSICAEACLSIVAPRCRSRWRSRAWESRLARLERGVWI